MQDKWVFCHIACLKILLFWKNINIWSYSWWPFPSDGIVSIYIFFNLPLLFLVWVSFYFLFQGVWFITIKILKITCLSCFSKASVLQTDWGGQRTENVGLIPHHVSRGLVHSRSSGNMCEVIVYENGSLLSINTLLARYSTWIIADGSCDGGNTCFRLLSVTPAWTPGVSRGKVCQLLGGLFPALPETMAGER